MIDYSGVDALSNGQEITVGNMDFNSGTLSSENILSQDQYFILGMTELLGPAFIESFFLIIDLDFNEIAKCKAISSTKKEVIAFASSDFAFYNSELFENIAVLDKGSSLKEIVSFFAVKNRSSNYRLRYNLTQREKQMLKMFREGESNKNIALMFGLKIKTIYTHRRNLMMKLGCENRIVFQKLVLKNRPITNE